MYSVENIRHKIFEKKYSTKGIQHKSFRQIHIRQRNINDTNKNCQTIFDLKNIKLKCFDQK